MPAFPLRGTRGLGEFLFLHRASRSLLVTDFLFHLKKATSPMDRAFLRMNDIYGVLRPSRIFRLLFTKNERELLEGLLPVLREDFNRIIMNHGEIIETGGKKAFMRAVEARFPLASAFFVKNVSLN